ncbi:MAG: PEP-CTERM sorting domain-containing protein [Cyanobacteria bacterium P01_F01_bin.86]
MQRALVVVGSTLTLAFSVQPAWAAFLAPGEVVTWRHDNGGIVRLDDEPVPFGASFDLAVGSTLEIGTGFTSLSLLSLPGAEDIEFIVELLPSDSDSFISDASGFSLAATPGEGNSTQVALALGSVETLAYGDREGFARAVITPATESVPEPLTVLGTLTAVGFGIVLKRQRDRSTST